MLIPFWTYSLQRKKSNCCLRKADYTFSIDYILQLNLIKKSKYIQCFIFLCMNSCCISNSAMQLKEKGSKSLQETHHSLNSIQGLMTQGKLCKPVRGWSTNSSIHLAILFFQNYWCNSQVSLNHIFVHSNSDTSLYTRNKHSLPTESGFS